MSKDVLRLNPGLAQSLSAGPLQGTGSVLDASGGSDTPQGAPKRRRRRVMNATEREFSLFLQSLKDQGQIYNFVHEGITLRWGSKDAELSYTPDFAVIESVEGIIKPKLVMTFFEIKGAYAWQKDIVKFKAAKAAHPTFEFQLHEKGPDGWQRTI